MTQYTGEATQRQKLKGCVQGIIQAVFNRVTLDAKQDQIALEAELGAVAKVLLDKAVELGEEKGKTTPGKEIVAITQDLAQAVNEFIEKHKLTPKEMPLIGTAVRQMVQEAHQAGWEK